MRLKELEYFIHGALEPNSRAALNSTVKCYSELCASIHVAPFPLSFQAMALYYIQYAHHFGHTVRSIPTMESHLKRANRERGFGFLCDVEVAQLHDVVTTLRKHDKSAPNRKLPLTHSVLDRIESVGDPSSLSHL